MGKDVPAEHPGAVIFSDSDRDLRRLSLQLLLPDDIPWYKRGS